MKRLIRRAFDPRSRRRHDRITGTFEDQAAIHGTLRRLREFGIPLTSLTQLDDDPSQSNTTGDTP
jgi:hypothetical protein